MNKMTHTVSDLRALAMLNSLFDVKVTEASVLYKSLRREKMAQPGKVRDGTTGNLFPGSLKSRPMEILSNSIMPEIPSLVRYSSAQEEICLLVGQVEIVVESIEVIVELFV